MGDSRLTVKSLDGRDTVVSILEPKTHMGNWVVSIKTGDYEVCSAAFSKPEFLTLIQRLLETL